MNEMCTGIWNGSLGLEKKQLSAQSRKGVLGYLCEHGSLSRGSADRRKTPFLDLHVVGNHLEKKKLPPFGREKKANIRHQNAMGAKPVTFIAQG